MEAEGQETKAVTEAELYDPASTIDAAEFHASQKEKSMVMMAGLFENTAQGVGQIYFSILKGVDFQAEELKIFRTMEVYIRRGTLTQEKLEEIMQALLAHRETVKQKIAEHNAAVSRSAIAAMMNGVHGPNEVNKE